jgi:hypothetical protein
MHYKTIVLNLLEQRPEYHKQLMSQRRLLSTIEEYAQLLNTFHEAWQEQLSHTKPGSDWTQIASEALELAIQDLERSLPSEPPAEAGEPLSLAAAMNFIRRHSQPE